MAASKPNLIVEIDDEEYSLDVVPADKSKVVVAAKERLLGAVDLKTILDDLGRVGAFIRIAYNGVGAAGPKFTEIQIEIQTLRYDVTRLCDQSALTVSKFKKASSTVLTDLQATYGYLLDNMEELAIETLSSVSKIAGDMEKAAMELHDEFKQKEKKEAQLINIGKERKQLEVERQKEEELMMDAQRLEREAEAECEAEAERQQMEMKEDEAIRSIGAPNNPLKIMLNAFTSPFGAKIFDERAAEKQAQHWKEKRIDALKKENEFHQQHYEALSRMTSLASKIKDCQTEANMAGAAADELHEAIEAVKKLSVVMMQAALFWKQMQDHCKSLAEENMTEQVEKAMKYPEEKRLKLWSSKPFKMKAVQFYAGWVALNSVCTVYVEHIKLIQKDLYEYLRENPTYEQSRENVKTLAERFLTDLKKDQQAIADKEFEVQEQIKALGDGSIGGQ